jgi:regulator of nonsense transcripts 3
MTSSTNVKTESSSTTGSTNQSSTDNLRKIVIRRLPPTMNKDQFLDIVSPLPDYDYMYFCNADLR